jgi:hypothetical protein
MTRSYIVDSLNLMISAALSKNYVMTTEVDLVIVISNNGTLNKTRIHEIMHSYLFPHKQAYPKGEKRSADPIHKPPSSTSILTAGPLARFLNWAKP